MVRRYVRSRNLVNEEAIAHWGLVRKKKLFQGYLIAYFAAANKVTREMYGCSKVK